MKLALHVLIACCVALMVAGAAGCGEDDPVVDAGPLFDAPPEVGTLSLSWAIEDSGNPLLCDQVGGLSVRVTATPQDGGFATPEAFGCDALSGTSSPIDSGIYNVEIVLVASGGQALSPPETILSVEIVTGQNSDLGSFVFPVVPRGSVLFVIDAQAVAGNCDTEANGGAEISEVLIEVLDAQGACVPATIAIAAGANLPEGTYSSDCAGARYACIDTDQQISIADVPSGTASLNIVGYRGVDACYSRMPQFSVAGNGLLTELLPQNLTAIGPCVMP